MRELVELAEADGLQVRGALATHYHPDHVGGDLFGHSIEGVKDLLELRPVKIHVQRAEAPWVKRLTGVSDSDLALHDSGDVVKVGDLDVQLIHTPGHTPGSQCFLVGKRLVAGDTLFLQGCGGDAKASIIGQGDNWRGGTWDELAQAGHTVAKEVLQGIGTGLAQVEPKIRCGLVDMEWPLQPAMDRAGFEALVADARTDDVRRLWAKRQLERLDRGQKLANSVAITLHGVALGKGLRLVGLEGEAVAELGLLMLDFYKGKGTTFPLGYTDGAQLYLPTSAMLDEGGTKR